MHNNELLQEHMCPEIISANYTAEIGDETLRIELIRAINQLIELNQWKQVDAADCLGVSQPRISNLLNNHVDKFSVDILITMLSGLGHKFRIAEWNAFSASTISNEGGSIREQGLILINKFIRQQNWAPNDTSNKLGLTQPRVSNLNNLHDDKFSLEIILRLLIKVGYRFSLEHNFDKCTGESMFTFVANIELPLIGDAYVQ